jgi:3',5'-cyclic AMP phosphodiesterase CpdA
MRIAATADLHYSAQTMGILKEQLGRVRDEADVLVVAGDLTNFAADLKRWSRWWTVLVRLRLPDCRGSRQPRLRCKARKPNSSA